MFRVVLLCVVSLWSGVSLAQSDPLVQKFTDSRRLLGTELALDVCYSPGQLLLVEDAVERVWARMAEINVRMNPYDSKSDVNLINRAEGSFVTVHDDVYALLRRSVDHHRLTQGVFDVTIAPLTALWKRAAKEGRWPSKAEVDSVKGSVNADEIEFGEKGQVRLRGKGVAVDLSGNAQGYAADEVFRILKAAGLGRFLMDAGGEIFASGLNCDGGRWRIGVRDPLHPKEVLGVIELQDAAVSTSGSYEKYFKINGQRLSHIIDPVSGYPANDVVSATVIAPTAEEADVLSTTLCVLGVVKGMALIDKLGAGYSAAIYAKGSQGGLVRAFTGSYENYLKAGKE